MATGAGTEEVPLRFLDTIVFVATSRLTTLRAFWGLVPIRSARLDPLSRIGNEPVGEDTCWKVELGYREAGTWGLGNPTPAGRRGAASLQKALQGRGRLVLPVKPLAVVKRALGDFVILFCHLVILDELMRVTCRVSCDYLPRRRDALFEARSLLQEIFGSSK